MDKLGQRACFHAVNLCDSTTLILGTVLSMPRRKVILFPLFLNSLQCGVVNGMRKAQYPHLSVLFSFNRLHWTFIHCVHFIIIWRQKTPCCHALWILHYFTSFLSPPFSSPLSLPLPLYLHLSPSLSPSLFLFCSLSVPSLLSLSPSLCISISLRPLSSVRGISRVKRSGYGYRAWVGLLSV